MSTRSQKIESLAEKELTLEDLPLELLFQIVGFLEQEDLISMTRVSRKLREITCNPRFWKKFQIDVAKRSVDYVKLIAGHCPLLQELSFTCSELHDDDEYSPLIDFLKKMLRQLYLELIRLFANCKLLEKLDMGNLEVTDKMAECIGSSFPRLKELKIMEGCYIRLEGLSHLAKLESLEKFYIPELSNLHGRDRPAALTIISQNFKNIREFGLRDLHLDASTNDAFVRVLETHRDGLKQLSVYTRDLPASTYGKIAECKNLVDLEITSDDIDDSCLSPLKALGNLKKLNIDGEGGSITSAGWRNFFSESASLAHLESLDLRETELCDVGLTSIAKNIPNLSYLRLSSCYDLSEGFFSIILENCQNLEALELDYSPSSPAPLNQVLDIPTKLPNLRDLFVNGPVFQPRLDAGAVELLRKLAPLLRVEVI